MAETRGIVHVYATHNNTMLLLTDLTGAETISKATGGMETKAQHKEGSPYVAMKLAENIANAAREKGIREIFVKVRGHGGNRSTSAGTGAEAAAWLSALRARAASAEISPLRRAGPS